MLLPTSIQCAKSNDDFDESMKTLKIIFNRIDKSKELFQECFIAYYYDFLIVKNWVLFIRIRISIGYFWEISCWHNRKCAFDVKKFDIILHLETEYMQYYEILMKLVIFSKHFCYFHFCEFFNCIFTSFRYYVPQLPHVPPLMLNIFTSSILFLKNS